MWVMGSVAVRALALVLGLSTLQMRTVTVDHTMASPDVLPMRSLARRLLGSGKVHARVVVSRQQSAECSFMVPGTSRPVGMRPRLPVARSTAPASPGQPRECQPARCG